MKYDEHEALRLQAIHKLPDATIRTWRHRGVIPDKYAKEGYRVPEKTKDDATAQRLRAILALPEIAQSNFRAFAKHPNYADGRQRAADVKKGHPLDARERKALLAELAELRNAISAAANVPTTSALRKVLKDKRIHAVNVLGRDLTRKALHEDGSAMLLPYEKKEVVTLLKALKSKLQV